MELTKQEKAELKKAAKKMAMHEFNIKEKDAKLLEEAMKEAKMPVKMTNKDFELGERELDVRGLNEENLTQMMFRMSILNVTYLRQITQSLVDVMQLLMLVLKQMGCDDIIKATENLIEETKKQLMKDKN